MIFFSQQSLSLDMWSLIS